MPIFKQISKQTLPFLLIFVFGLLLYFIFCLPQTLFNKPYSKMLYSEEGKLLSAHIAKDQQWRFPNQNQIPDNYKQALIAFEDQRFEDHCGVDIFAVFRALLSNLQAGRIVSGASTISMQVIRLSREKNRTFTEKIIETIWALRLEWRYSKAEILQLYTNHAPYGGNIVGLETAAYKYFARSTDQLSWAEVSMLAVLPNSPSLIHLNRNRDLLLKKRNALLLKLKNQSSISEEQYQLSIKEKIPNKTLDLPHLNDPLLQNIKFSKAQHTFKSTLNFELQTLLYQKAKIYAEKLAGISIHNLAVLVIDNQTFKIKAYIGNSPSKNRNAHGLFLDLMQAKRSTGSTLKPFLYASMLDSGQLTPQMLIPDAPMHFKDFSPENFDHTFKGAIPAAEALAKSVNVPAVYMLEQYGVIAFLKILNNLQLKGISRSGEYYGLSLIIGGAESTLRALTGAYANLAALAQSPHTNSHERYFYKNTILQNSEQSLAQEQAILINSEEKRTSDISPAAAYLTMQALIKVQRPQLYGYWQDFQNQQEIAWKTGTSQGFRDAWAVGSTPKYTVGIWVGNANGEGHRHLVGSKAAAPLLFDVFESLKNFDRQQNRWSTLPKPALKSVEICIKDGYKSDGLCQSTQSFIPPQSHLKSMSPHFKKIFVTQDDRWQIRPSCESKNIKEKIVFQLPAEQAHYYKKHHTTLSKIPKWRDDCEPSSYDLNKLDFALIYPGEGSQLLIPRKTNKNQEKIIFEALHQDEKQKLFWYIDDTFMGSTTNFHQISIHLVAGTHKVTLLDKNSQKIERQFTILQSQD